ncbi:surface-adhesin E family protein [Paraburkholderia dilworthii]|uniref:surface-adhesin E family protein n=1 Tax=Paraburkholderia dilworthii TaxID=948106 RepID=UPI00041B5415|nr:surface-adhesin E family protein [Paraburkholderia dilworthii]
MSVALGHGTLKKPPYPLTLFEKVEIDLNSIHKTGDGGITVWNRETYVDKQIVSSTEIYRIGEARYWFDCTHKLFNIDYVHTRKIDGTLVRSRPIEVAARRNDNPIPPNSLISSEADLACRHAAEI